MSRAALVDNVTRIVPGSGSGQVLLMSMRNLASLVAYSMTYEFEDVITQVTDADRVDVANMPRMEFSRRAYKLMRYTSGSRRLARSLAPPSSVVTLERDYELFFPTFNHAYELYALASIPNWRKRCRVAACFVSELWVQALPKYLLELLHDFDHVFVGVRGVVNDVARIAGRPCTYLPLAADVLTFSPLGRPPLERMVEVCNIGRRSEVTHAALLQRARDRNLFYFYDTVAASGTDHKQRTFEVQNAAEHRLLLANLLRRSRFYLANRSRVNDPEFTNGHEEISGRFFEGAAAGTIMLGQPPACQVFDQLFNWPNAVIHLPFHSPDVGAILDELTLDSQRLSSIGRENARNAALRHDWLHRLISVFDMLGIAHTEGMLARHARLLALAASTAAGSVRGAQTSRPTPVSVPLARAATVESAGGGRIFQ